MTADGFKHEKIRGVMLARLRSGDWAEGARLPGSRPLAQELGASQGTIEKVLLDLVQQGFLLRRERSGTFVAPRSGWGQQTPERERLVAVLGDLPQPLLTAAAAEFRRRGYGLLLHPGVTDLPAARAAAAEAVRCRACGFLWTPLSTHRHDDDNNALAQLLCQYGPAVAVDRYPRDVEVDCVVSGNAQAGYELTRHLLELGHRRIGLVRHAYGSTPEDRQHGYRRALAEAGIRFASQLVFSVPHEIPSAELVTRLREWLRKQKPAAAWSICGHPLGNALLAAAQAEGLRVPEDLSVATFDELVAAQPVTAMLQPFAETGLRAAELLCDRMEHPQTSEIRRISLPCRFVPGASCASPAGVAHTTMFDHGH